MLLEDGIGLEPPAYGPACASRSPEPVRAARSLTLEMHVPAEIKHLHEVAEKGEAPETPAILVGEVALFLLPILAVMLGIGFGLYFAFGGPG